MESAGARHGCNADEEPACWVCLRTASETACEPAAEDLGELITACACPRVCHGPCLARWQLQSAGRSEEHACRFCGQQLQDWRATLIQPRMPEAAPLPVMAICFEGQIHRVQVQPGPEGRARFQQQIRELLQLEDEEEFDVHFSCKAPYTGSMVQLSGLGAFDAATACAAVSAAERQRRAAQAGGVAAAHA